MHKNNGSGPRPTYVKLTLEERRFVSTWVRENRLEGEFDSLNRLTPNQLDERVAELALINNVLWHVESTDLDTAEGISDALISNPQVVEFLRQEVAQFGYLLASGEYFSRDDERTATANRLEDKFGVDRRWLLDEPKKVAV